MSDKKDTAARRNGMRNKGYRDALAGRPRAHPSDSDYARSYKRGLEQKEQMRDKS